MHSKKDSLLKRWHTLTASPKSFKQKWSSVYWHNDGTDRIISCQSCPSFDQAKSVCSINFGTPLRKCVVSSIEAHFNDCYGQDALEIGFGRFKLAKKLIQRSGGRWTGIEPRLPQSKIPRLGEAGYGSAEHIPFADETFNKVFAIQSVEHWGQKAQHDRQPSSYRQCLQEIHRVLKKRGKIYFDAPVHFHGHEMFIMGDVVKVKSLFNPSQWRNVVIERWRENYTPLEKYVPSENEISDWPIEVSSYSQQELDNARQTGVIWLMVITAEKI